MNYVIFLIFWIYCDAIHAHNLVHFNHPYHHQIA
jgi:hypothetical protein